MINPALPERLSQFAGSASLLEPGSRGAPLANGNSQAHDFAALVDAASTSEALPVPELRSMGSPPIAMSKAAPAAVEDMGLHGAPATEQLPGSLLPVGGQIVPLPPPPQAPVEDNDFSSSPEPAGSLGPDATSGSGPSQASGAAAPLATIETLGAPALAEDQEADAAAAAEELPESTGPEGGSLAAGQIAAALMSGPVPVRQQDPARLSASVSIAAPAKDERMMSRTDAAAAPLAALGKADGLPELGFPAAQTAEEAAIGGTVRALQDDGRAGLLMRALPADPASAGIASVSHAQSAPAAPLGSAIAAARADASPPVELDSTIAQVIEIREALRSARPQMTLQHAEFGLVSLRLETSGAVQDWRAVLASRDPGFAPAFQAALAERALTATASTSSNATGTGAGPGSGHGGFASQEQRYGFLPGSGQGSSLPYLAQSGQRDEGASQQHGQHHSRRDEAAPPGPDDVGRSGDREQGLFA